MRYHLTELVKKRLKESRAASPTCAIIDSQSEKTANATKEEMMAQEFQCLVGMSEKIKGSWR